VTRDYRGVKPRVHASSFVAETAVIIGDVHVGEESSIWYNTVIRGDVNQIRIGSGSNIQDMCVLHVTGAKGKGEEGHPLYIGSDVTVGHAVTLHGCTIEDGAFIGMNAVILDGCRVCRGAMVAAGSLLTPGTFVPEGTLWMGAPAKFKRNLSNEERSKMTRTAAGYRELAANYRGNAPLPEGDLP